MGVVITLCLGKEEEPARGDLDAEAHHLADEAKKALPCHSTRSKPSPHPNPLQLPYAPFLTVTNQAQGAGGSLLSSTRQQRVPTSEGGT